jgi:hypothetical protein
MKDRKGFAFPAIDTRGFIGYMVEYYDFWEY